MVKSRGTTVGLFVLSVATLLFEVALTRIFAVSLWGPFAFLVVSLALLGFGASGTFLHLQKRPVGAYGLTPLLSFILFFLSAGAIYRGIGLIPFDPVRISWDPWQFVWLSLFYLAAAVPFFFSGLYIGSCFRSAPARSHRTYAVNLAGSALGALLSLSFLNLPLESAKMSPYKPLPQALLFPGARILATRWGPEARVDLVESGAVRFAPGLSLEFPGELPEQIGIARDGNRMDAVTRFDGDFSKLSFLSFLPSAAPYSLLTAPKVLVVEGGGGLDLLEALFHGAASVTALERNDDIVRLVDREWGDFSGSPYSHSKVKRVAQQARRYLSASSDRFDLIVLPSSDNPSAGSTGLYGLNENYLYTVEAFQDLINHLRPDGILTLTRFLLPPPREEPRTFLLAAAALRSLGVSDPFRQMTVIESYGTWTLILKRSPFTEEEREILHRFSEEKGFALIDSVATLLPKDSLFNLSPTTDDRPFFFHFLRISRARETYRELRGKWEAFFEGGYLTYAALAQAVFWGVLLVLIPALFRKSPHTPLFQRGAGGILLYFFAIGLAFMFVEMAFLQKAIFLFGNPTSGLALLLASLLFFSGLGSLAGEAIPFPRDHPRGTLFLLAGLIGLSVFLKNPVAGAIVGIPIFFLMGLPFPRVLARIDPARIPLAWAVNGVASVIGAILAVVIALEWGYSRTLAAAGLLYLCAMIGFPAISSVPLPSSERSGRR